MTDRIGRRAFLAATGSLALAGCVGSPDPGSDGGDGGDGGATGTDGRSGGGATTDSGTADTTSGGASDGSVPTADATLTVQHDVETIRKETVSGGPPKDGIPSVDDPKFEGTDSTDQWLADGDVVFGIVHGGETKAYPQRILVWHEIANDVVGGDPLSITYCPLTGTAMAFHRGETTFGVSGNLVNSNLVMYDRASDSRWPQVLATAVEGPHEGSSLREERVVWTTYGQWKHAHPDTKVLTKDTGYARNYDRDPYGKYNPRGGYYENDNLLFGPLSEDDRLPKKAVVLGVRTGEGAGAVRKSTLREAGVVTFDVGGSAHLAVYDPTLNTGYVYANPDGLSFERTDEGVEGPDGTHAANDLPLDPVMAFDAMWFAWAGFYPETTLHA